MDNYVVGIDISSSKICGVVGKLNDEYEIQIAGVTSSDYAWVNDSDDFRIEDVSYVLEGVLGRLSSIIGTALKKVYVSVPISLCEIVKTKGVVSFPEIKEITREDIDNVCEVARFSVGKDKDIVQVDIEEYSVDDNINVINPIGMKGKLLQSEGNAFILNNKYIKMYKKCFEKAGVEIAGWIISSIGVSKDILSSDEMKNGVAVIDAGADRIEASVFSDNDFVDSLSIPYGGKIITNDVSVCLKLSKSDSERLKLKCKTLVKERLGEFARLRVTTEDGRTVEANYELLVEVINARVCELLELIHKKLVSEELEDKVKSYVIVGGGLGLFRDIVPVAEEILEKPVRIGIPEYVGAANPIYATAIGVVSYVLKEEQRFLDRKISGEEQHENDDIVRRDGKFKGIIKQFLKSFSNEEEVK